MLREALDAASKSAPGMAARLFTDGVIFGLCQGSQTLRRLGRFPFLARYARRNRVKLAWTWTARISRESRRSQETWLRHARFHLERIITGQRKRSPTSSLARCVKRQPGCASPKFDPGRRAWGLTQRGLVFVRPFSPKVSELESLGGLPTGRSTPVGHK